MIALADKKPFYTACALFLVLLVYFSVKTFYWFYLLPVLLLVAMASLVYTRQLFFLLVFIVPLSINFDETPLGFGINIPTEPISFGLMLIAFFKIIMDGGIPKRFLFHPLTILILLHLVWMLITTLTSQLPLVSFKFTLGRLCFVTVFFLYAVPLFSDVANIKKFVWLYLASLLIVIGYTTFNHASEHFTEAAAHSAMTPFYYDHTQYAAMIAMFLPLVSVLLLSRFTNTNQKPLLFLIFAILATGMILSYTRAAWLGLIAATACSIIFIFRIHTTLVYAAIIGFVVLVLINLSSLILNFETNKEASDDNMLSHIKSATNIKTDASNVERINRWSCAIKLFEEKPWVGWGPGTYQFVYGPFQQYNQTTYISTKQGNRGNAHSEYLNPLAEQGWPATLLFVAIAIATVVTASQFIIQTNDNGLRIWAIGLLLGMITYWVHGFLNNFLHTEKASIPFWGFTAAILALRLYHINTKPTTKAL
ncbi:MAG: O-antigen ligase family protein [Bacteroidia bacterium]|nr:O-antigen ligase family protein [Bacteroidia bacterium]